ncbi:alpha/beta hydrolase [Thalassolituus sp.]|uniref:alpha/beta hydrolase n=1 Tax=Thalassolituus sp. TaxID=2030822 RepID=UPI003515306C|nr:MAG: thioesterase [Thalassolituus sp.]
MFRKLVWLPVASLISACSPLGLVNAVSNVYQVDERRDIAYGELDRQTLDLYLPRTSGAGHTQVILFFYGGSWNSGSRAEYRFVGRRLADEGYIVAVADYRLYPEVRYPDFLYDSAKAVKKVSELIHSDMLSAFNPSARITLMGHSAGAYNAAMMALDPRWLKNESLERESTINGWVGLAGPYDLYPISVEDVKPVFFHPDYPADSNPIDFADQAVVPSLLLVPEDDDLVNPDRNSRALADRLSQQKATVRLEEIQGTNHSTLIGTLSPVLFFKGSSLAPINDFIQSL